MAANRFNLVLVGRKVTELADTASSLNGLGVEVRTQALDLTAPDVIDQVRSVTDDVHVGLLICNAGANSYGSTFMNGDLERFRLVVEVNVASRLALVHHFGGLMKQRRRGGILLVGSMAGYRGSPYTVLYNAAKAFGRVFAEGLWSELQPFDVDVVEFVVGAMRTPAMARNGMKFGPEVADPVVIAEEGLAHIGDGPVWNSEAAGGDATGVYLSRFPRPPVVAEAAAALKSLGLYTDVD